MFLSCSWCPSLGTPGGVPFGGGGSVRVLSLLSSVIHGFVFFSFVVLHAVRVSIGCVHLCFILCCVARSLYIHWLRAFMLSCLV